jgi:ubiquinone/menaquinone biosynthesis C-methylase UbiE
MKSKTHSSETVEDLTGSIFGKLWHAYDDALFKQSVEMFSKRWEANGESPDFFKDKTCLDAGCGGGRYSVAMALMGAKKVLGIDVGEEGVSDARKRAGTLKLGQVEFMRKSVLKSGLPSESYDFVCCCGVLHHTVGVERGLSEIFRMLKPGGSVYLLLYGAGGVYWPLNLLMRSTAQHLGLEEVDRCIGAAKLPANKRRTVLDDLFVPVLETYSAERVEFLLQNTGFARWRRWASGQMDHEATARSMLAEIIIRQQMWSAGAGTAPSSSTARLESLLADQCQTVVEIAQELIAQEDSGGITAGSARAVLVGTGHHRIIAEKP